MVLAKPARIVERAEMVEVIVVEERGGVRLTLTAPPV
jgi:hypothetical protein